MPEHGVRFQTHLLLWVMLTECLDSSTKHFHRTLQIFSFISPSWDMPLSPLKNAVDTLWTQPVHYPVLKGGWVQMLSFGAVTYPLCPRAPEILSQTLSPHNTPCIPSTKSTSHTVWRVGWLPPLPHNELPEQDPRPSARVITYCYSLTKISPNTHFIFT